MDLKPSEPDDQGSPATPAPPNLYRVAWVFYLALATIALIWIGIRDGGISTNLLWAADLSGSGRLVSLATDLGLGLASAAAIIWAWELGERFSSAAAEVGAQLRSMLQGLTPSEAVGLALLSGVSEELFFRGALQQAWDGWAGWAIATALFAVLHGGPGKHFRWWTLFAAFAGGLMGAWLLLRGTLVAPVVTHIAVNAFQLVRAARRGTS